MKIATALKINFETDETAEKQILKARVSDYQKIKPYVRAENQATENPRGRFDRGSNPDTGFGRN